MADSDSLELQVKVWEKTIDVQQHFNDIGMRVRNLFVTLLAAVFAVLGYAVKSTNASGPSATVSLSSLISPYMPMIVTLGVFICVAFWFLDRWWYHRLLRGAVIMGSDLETRLEPVLGDIGLTRRITNESRIPIGRFQLDATFRLDLFYGSFLVALVLFVEYVNAAQIGAFVGTGVATVAALALAFWRSQARRVGSLSTRV